ncbi:FmdB family zinc ribbon protein [Arsenicicoccus bolidensis]|uniref:FmdB family zinc ribbon protein n=1 Tax=Arsenicicoccus bolidensis TaxID=229480 RepID=UPI0028ACBA8A|nr:FmdB family zinc ribbon protein [Arsenicicoccus bolidensis]
MPTYSYRCADCGEAFDIVQSFTDDALTVCPRCEGLLRKVYNSVGVVFKGSGFYRTDSRGKDGKATASTTASSSDSSSSTSGSSTSSGSNGSASGSGTSSSGTSTSTSSAAAS